MSGELTFATVPETDRWAQHLGIEIVEITPGKYIGKCIFAQDMQ